MKRQFARELKVLIEAEILKHQTEKQAIEKAN